MEVFKVAGKSSRTGVGIFRVCLLVYLLCIIEIFSHKIKQTLPVLDTPHLFLYVSKYDIKINI